MATPTDKINDGLAVAGAGLSLVERLARLFTPDPVRKAARLRGKARRLYARSLTVGSDKRADRMVARADGLAAQAAALLREAGR